MYSRWYIIQVKNNIRHPPHLTSELIKYHVDCTLPSSSDQDKNTVVGCNLSTLKRLILLIHAQR